MGKAKKNKPAAKQTAQPAAEQKTAPAQAQPEAKEAKKEKRTWVLHPRTGGGLALHIILDLVVPYAYLMLCGLIFDKALRMYNMTTFVFFSYAVLQLAGIVLAILCIVNYCRRSRKKK